MARESTFPADDVSDRLEEVLAVLRTHHPVPVPVTSLYLGIRDKRALAQEFVRLEEEGRIERTTVQPGEAHYDACAQLAADVGAFAPGPLPVYRLTKHP